MMICLTGATGFAGRALVPRLAARYPVAAMRFLVLPGDPLRPGFEQNMPANGTIVEGDVTCAGDVMRFIAEGTWVIHLAGLISYWRHDLQRLEAINVQGVRNVVEACTRRGVKRLVHISSVGAVGFHPDGTPSDEDTPYNWPESLPYMATKHAGQRIVEEAAGRLDAIVLCPASLMGPGDPVPTTPLNRLHAAVYRGAQAGCFAGGLALVDVRDLADLIVASLERGEAGERYLAVGANLPYTEVIRALGRHSGRKVRPFVVPPAVLSAAGFLLECASSVSRRRPLLTAAYGRLSGWTAYYSNAKSRRAFAHEYIPFEQTIADGCRYFERTFLGSK